jgi:DNA helicase-2/ATP-dependent DNA helicase PcrA
MKLSKLQEDIVNAPEPVIFVEASAAAGKSATIVEKVKRNLNTGKKVVAFTFTNMAAGEMKKRLGISNSDEIYIGTIHSYCAQLLLRKGIEEARRAIDQENFDELFELIDEHREAIEPVDLIICDEAQDSDELQFRFMFDLIHAPEYFICYDRRQSIYQWAGARPELLDDYAEKLNATIYSLNENYRNAPRILGFAKELIEKTGMYDDSIPMRKDRQGVVKSVPYSKQVIVESINTTRQYNRWAFLARTNAEVDDLCRILASARIPYDTFKQGDLKKEELDDRMSANTVKVLTMHSAKGLEWDFVGVYDARFYNREERCLAYVAATRARDGLLWLTKPRLPRYNGEKVYDWSFNK